MIRALLLLLLALPALSAGQSDERAIKPEIRVGDSWTYRSTHSRAQGPQDHEALVTFVDGRSILLVSSEFGAG